MFSLFSLWWLFAAWADDRRTLQFLIWPAAMVAVLTAVYSAFLFGQAQGRDFWQSPLLFWHLFVAAAVAGAAMLALVGSMAHAGTQAFVSGILLGGLLAHFLVLMAELLVPHPNADTEAAARLMVRGRFWGRFWGGAVGAGIGLPVLLLAPFAGGAPPIPVALLAALSALGGLFVYEDLWLKAGQAVPLS
jgi:formate-dependent nitrite reductase membrane component NrfD